MTLLIAVFVTMVTLELIVPFVSKFLIIDFQSIVSYVTTADLQMDMETALLPIHAHVPQVGTEQIALTVRKF